MLGEAGPRGPRPIFRFALVSLCLAYSAPVRAQNLPPPILSPGRGITLVEGDQPSEVKKPSRILLAPDGRLFLTDHDKRDVLWFDENFVWQGSLQSWLGGERFERPIRTRVDSQGRVLVADEDERAIWVLAEGSVVDKIGGKGDEYGRFDRLDDIALDGDDFIYAVDSGRDRIQVFTPEGLLERVLDAFGPYTLDDPRLIAVDSSHRIYVYDKNLEMVLAGYADGSLAWNATKDEVFEEDGEIVDLDVDPYGAVYLLGKDRNRLFVLGRSGELLATYLGRDGSPEFDRPVGISTGKVDAMTVLDRDDRRVQELRVGYPDRLGLLRPAGRTHVGKVQRMLDGQPLAFAAETDEAPARVLVRSPAGLEVRSTDGSRVARVDLGKLPERIAATGTSQGFVVVDRERSLVVLDRDGRLVGRWSRETSGGELEKPAVLAWSAPDDVLAVYDEDGDDLFLLGPDGSFRQRIGRRGSGPGEIDDVRAMAFDSNGRLMVVDAKGDRFQVFDRFGILERGPHDRDGGIADVSSDSWGHFFILERETGLARQISDQDGFICQVGRPSGSAPDRITASPSGEMFVGNDRGDDGAIAMICDGPPPRPRHLTLMLESLTADGVGLAWSRDVPRADSYVVYESVEDGEWSEVGISDSSGYRFSESEWPAVPRRLAVAAVDRAGRRSGLSNEVTDRLSPVLRTLRDGGDTARAEGWLDDELAERDEATGAVDVPALVRLRIQLIAAQGEFGRALSMLEEESARLGAEATARIRVAIHRSAIGTALEAGEGETALGWLELMVELPEATLTAVERQAHGFAVQGETRVAILLLTSYGDDELTDAELSLAIARILMRVGEPGKALETLILASNRTMDPPTRDELDRNLEIVAEDAVEQVLDEAADFALDVDTLVTPLFDALEYYIEPLVGEHQERWRLRMEALRAKPRIHDAVALAGSDFARARTELESILTEHSFLFADDEVRIHAHLGALALAAGDDERAREEFTRALEVLPGWDPDADEFSPSVRRYVSMLKSEVSLP